MSDNPERPDSPKKELDLFNATISEIMEAKKSKAEKLAERLYNHEKLRACLDRQPANHPLKMRKNRMERLAMFPDDDPLYPKRITGFKVTGGRNGGAQAHFSQLHVTQKPLTAQQSALSANYREERQLIASLTEPMDSIDFLKGAAPGTFFYMQRVDALKRKLNFNEDAKQQMSSELQLLVGKEDFDLMVCPHDYVDLRSYYTISIKGVTYISEQQQSFTELQEWMTELTKLSQLRKIGIFKNFRLWKPLKILKRAVKVQRRDKAVNQLTADLFMAKNMLRQALFVILDCTNGIRSMNVLVTQIDIDSLNKQRQILRQQQKKAAAGLSALHRTHEQKHFSDLLKQLQLLFDNFCRNMPLQAIVMEDENQTNIEDGTAFDNQTADPNFEGNSSQFQVFSYPFTISEFDSMSRKRCDDLSQLFNYMTIFMTEMVREALDQYILDQFADKGDGKEEKKEKQLRQATSYTERAARINACRRMLSYLRTTDFMIMDSMYDFAFTTLSKLYSRMKTAGELMLPKPEDVVASQTELKNREKTGLYKFEVVEDDAAPEAEPDKAQEIVFDDEKSLLEVGIGKFGVFKGEVMVKVEGEVKGLDLRQENDPNTPGQDIFPGQVAKIIISPSYDDFYKSLESFNESILNVEMSVRRLTNHEDFSDVSLPLVGGGEAQFGQVPDDHSKLALLQDLNAPNLSILFTSNPAFNTLVTNLQQVTKEQYEAAVSWSKILQPFYDAFNDCNNLDIDALQNTLFKLPISFWPGYTQYIDNPQSKELKHFQEQFARISFNSIKTDVNDYAQVLTEFLTIDYKEMSALLQQYAEMTLTSKTQVPLCSKSGLTKFNSAEFLMSDDMLNELLNKMEYYRRLHFSMPEQINLGLYTFSSENLKLAFVPMSQRVIEFIKTAIPLAAAKRIYFLIINMIYIEKYLNTVPKDIEEFIMYKEIVALVSDETIDNIKKFSENIFQIIAMYTQHNAKVPKQIEILFKLFHDSFETFKSKINFIEANLEQQITHWLELQQKECEEQETKLKALKDQMRLKILNRQVGLFTLAEFSSFFKEYQTSFVELDTFQQATQEKVITLRNKLSGSSDPNAMNDPELKNLEESLHPDFMVCPPNKLTIDIIMQQHEYFVLKGECEEEKQEDDELEDEVIEKPEEEKETQMQEEGDEEEGEQKSEEQSNKQQQQENKEEEVVLAEQFIPLKDKLSSVILQLKYRTKKTEVQKQSLDVVEARIKQIQGYQVALGSEPNEFPVLEVVSNHIRQFDNLWKSCATWNREILEICRTEFFSTLDIDTIQSVVANAGKVAFQCERTITTSQMPLTLKARVQEMRQAIPIIQSLDNPTLQMQHWTKVGEILGNQVDTIKIIDQTGKGNDLTKPIVTLNWLIGNQALLHKDDLSQVSNTAANEANLDKIFTKCEAEWAAIVFQQFKFSHDILVLRDTTDLVAKLEDSLLVISGVACSRYLINEQLKARVEKLLLQLTQLNAAIDVCLKVQKGYLYLINIFSSGDIQHQLPNETKMFQDMDLFWRKLMNRICDYPQVFQVLDAQIVIVKDENELKGLSTRPSLIEIQLKRYELQLDVIQKSLDNYLLSKRLQFARMFFISDDELLDLLAKAKNPEQLQGHMRKLFENVVSVDMVNNPSAGGLEITAMFSEEGEKLNLVQTVKPRGPVTSWLKNLEDKMCASVQKSIKSSIETYKNYANRNDWIKNNHAQSVIAVGQVQWTAKCSEAIDNINNRDAIIKTTDDHAKTEEKGIRKDKQTPLQQYCSQFEAELYNLMILVKGTLTKIQRASVMALATIETHSRDTIFVLIQKKVVSTDDFEFQKLLRYYYDPTNLDCPLFLKQNTTQMPYRNEYLGASGRLVITPLTDLCYLHIASAIQNTKAVNLQGPAGTGKSETTKDQNKARANSCVVFNCSETVEISVMNRFFMGFCISGAGSCLDEFNRLELSLLSVIAGSIKCILDGLRVARLASPSQQNQLIFDGRQIPLNRDTLIAISLNPGYAGRAELPQNLKNLFRSFSMVVPDYALISEIMLFSNGFATAKPLSRKVVQLYKLSSEQLSQQNSYDFGMRGVKSVLSMAGNLRRKFPDQSEEFVLIRAMQDSNLPRMIADDRDLFMGIIQDLFPNVVYKKSTNADLVRCIERSMKEHQYEINEIMIEKISQLFETSQIRHGCCMTGQSQGGKSVCLRTLAESLGYLRQIVDTEYSPEERALFNSNYPYTIVNPTDIYLMNAKAVTMNELYGAYDESTGEWKDGLLGNIMRNALALTSTGNKCNKQFILFDAHVSTEWIESMNSLLDDSKLLCLANSERLKINEYINIIFECENLKHASPATVSRLGIIFYPDCPLSDTIKVSTLKLKPVGGTRNMSEEEIAELDSQILAHAINSSLTQSIVRWDHIVISWLDHKLVELPMFSALNQVAEPGSVEEAVYQNIRLLILKLIHIFVPFGLKYFTQVKSKTILPTDEIQLVQQLLKIFASLFNYNRSIAVELQQKKQEENNAFAAENGIADATIAQDVTELEQIDITLVCRFLALQYVYRNQTIFQQPPNLESLNKSLIEYVLLSNEYTSLEQLIKNVFMYSFIWAFGGILACGSKVLREEFDNLVRGQIETCNDKFTQQKLKEIQGDDELNEFEKLEPFQQYKMPKGVTLSLIPNSGTVFDYYINWMAFISLQQDIVQTVPWLPVADSITSKYPNLINKLNTSFKISKCNSFLDNFSNISGLFSQGIEELDIILSNEALIKPGEISYDLVGKLQTEFIYRPSIAFFSQFVETPDTLRYQHLLESLIKSKNQILLTGESGSGRTCLIANLLDSMDKRQISHNITVNFSAKTTSLRISSILEDSFDKRRKNLIGPPIGKVGVVFIDDLNLPAKDIYECSQPIEFLRTLMDQGGFYDRKELFWKSVADTVIMSSCAPPGGGRETLTQRLTDCFVLIAQPESEDSSLIKIYNCILENYYKYYDYGQEILQNCSGVVKALIQVYHTLSDILKPTPLKLHYSFTLRDVSKVIQGLMRGSRKELKTSENFISLFIHEVMRTFADRTVNDFDKELICKSLTEVLNNCPVGLKKPIEYVVSYDDEGTMTVPLDQLPENPAFNELYGTFLKFGTPLEERQYETKDTNNVQQVLYQYLEQYNTEPGKQKMNLVLFDDAVKYVCKISRILSSDRGNLLNVGIGGSGRKSLTMLAAHICEYKVVSIKLKKGYTQNDFHDEVRDLYMDCGIKGTNIVFLLDESQLVSDAILEDINNILNSGVISNLFDAKETDNIMTEMRKIIKEKNLEDTVDPANKSAIFNFFINRVRDRLHVVLCLSPSGDEFRARLRTFPSLLTCMSIVWFHPWPRSALQDVSQNILKQKLVEVDFSALAGTEDVDALQKYARSLATKFAPIATEIHSNTERLLSKYATETNRRHYLPPATFLDLLNIYSKLLNSRIVEISTRMNQYTIGVEKLVQAAGNVEMLQKKAEELQPELEKKTFITNDLMARMDIERQRVEDLRKKVQEEVAIVASETKNCEIAAADAQKSVDAAEPDIIAAQKAVDQIDSGKIAEIKAMVKPGPVILAVLQVVAVMLGFKTQWAEILLMLSKADFLQNVKSYDKENIPENVMKQIEKMTSDTDLFDPVKIKNASLAVFFLNQWVQAIIKYAIIFRDVEPKRRRLKELQAKLAEKQAALKVKQDALRLVEEEFALLEQQFQEKAKEKQDLEDLVNLTKARLNRAEKLTTALADEKIRWTVQAQQLKELLTMAVGDVFLASCGIGYFGVFNRGYRDQLLQYWYGLLQIYQVKTSPLEQIQAKGLFGLISSDEMIVENWKDCELPSDMQSIDNAVIMDKIMTSKWPLLIDPQNQAANFIKKLEQNIKVYRPSQQGLSRSFQAALRAGDVILLDGVSDKLDPALAPVIERQFILSANGSVTVLLDGETIDVHPDFKLYITTKLQNPKYSPEIHAKLQIINFSISVDALQTQILNKVIQQEYPELDKTRVELTAETSKNKKLQIKLADQILYQLTSFKGDVLDNEGLIQVLNESKSTAELIQQKEIESVDTRAKIDKYYSLYQPIGVRTTLIYFLISDMSMIEPMYLFSLSYYLFITQREIAKVEDFKGDEDKIKERVEIIIDKTTFSLFTSIARGLFEKDKSIFAFLLGCRIQQRMGNIRDTEWQLFVKGSVFADIFINDPKNQSDKQLLTQSLLEKIENTQFNSQVKQQLQVMALEQYMNSLCELFVNDFDKILILVNSAGKLQDVIITFIINLQDKEQFPELAQILSKYNTTVFQRLILVRILADQYFFLAIPPFVECLLDERYATIRPQPIKALYADSTPFSPILFIIAEGVDPLVQTQTLAEEYQAIVHIISLGKGQTKIVEDALKQATTDGSWVFLQNVHLSELEFLGRLENIVETLMISANDTTIQYKCLSLPVNPNFRLFLSSTPVSHFPQSVLQASLKCTTEPPIGMKNNIRRSIANMDQNLFELTRLKSTIPESFNQDGVMGSWKRLVYSVCFFHAIVLERKKFGPQGYNLFYDFNDTDLEICILTLEDFYAKVFNNYALQKFQDHFIDLDWAAIDFIFAAIHYGGKVNDSWDKRTLQSMLRSIINSGIIECNNVKDAKSLKDYSFVQEDPRYSVNFINHESTIQSITEEINKFPAIDATNVFGMTENSQIVNQQAETIRIIERVLGISADCLESKEKEAVQETDQIIEEKKEDGQERKKLTKEQIKERIHILNIQVFGKEEKITTMDEIVSNIATSLLDRLPKLLNINDATPKSLTYDSNGIPHCLSTILKQEMERFNLLLILIKDSLTNIKLAIKGDVILSSDLERQYKSLYIGQVPADWSKIAYPSLKPLAAWYNDLILRMKFMYNWLTIGRPRSYWISGLYFPQGFVTALLQTHARKFKISIDTLRFNFEYSTEEWIDWEGKQAVDFEQHDSAVWVHGLFIDCGFFDKTKMQLQPSQLGILYPKMNYIRFVPTDKELPWAKEHKDQSLMNEPKYYQCPVYKTSQRAGVLSSTGHSTNFVLPVFVPSEFSEDFYVRMGTCFLCQLSD